MSRSFSGICLGRHIVRQITQEEIGVYEEAFNRGRSPGIGSIRRLGKETRAAGLCIAGRPLQRMALLHYSIGEPLIALSLPTCACACLRYTGAMMGWPLSALA